MASRPYQHSVQSLAIAEGSSGPNGTFPTGLFSRVLLTLGLLLVFRLGCSIPIPSLHPDAIASLFPAEDTAGTFSTPSATLPYQWTSIFGLGLAPYFLAMLIVRVTQVFAPGRSNEARGDDGRSIRVLTLLLAALMALAYDPSLMLKVSPDVPFSITTVVSLTAGAMLLMWLGEQITRRGIGYGPALIVAIGFIVDLPFVVFGILEMRRQGVIESTSLLLMGLLPAIIAMVVFFERARRRILVVNPGHAGGRDDGIGLRINQAGILPPLVSNTALFFVSGVVPVFASDGARQFDGLYDVGLALDPSQPLGLVTQAAVIAIVTVLFRRALFNPQNEAGKLDKAGAFIPGIRPGAATVRYIASVQNRLTAIGAGYLIVVCLAPMFVVSAYGAWIYNVIVGLVIAAITLVDLIDRLTGSRSQERHSV